MEQRKEFLEAAVRGEYSFTELCRRFGISRKNGYKWLNRYRDELAFPNRGASFADRSRRPHRSPTAIAPEVEAAIVEVRRQRPHWGPKKLRVVLAKQNPELALPSESTFAAVLKRHGLVRPRRKRAKSTPYTTPLDHASKPNAVWAIDFKGDFPVGRTRCYPLTITDSHSRFIIAIVALPNTRTQTVKRAMQRVFDEYGLPDAIRSDNGSPFSSRGLAGLSTLSVWWHKLGIRHERIDPGHPEQNGRHERMHLDLKRETASPPATTLAKQQLRFDQFRARFNQERPHEALDQRTPHEFLRGLVASLADAVVGKGFRVRHGGPGAARLERRSARDASRSLLLEYDPGARAHRDRLVRAQSRPRSLRHAQPWRARRESETPSAPLLSRRERRRQSTRDDHCRAIAKTVTHVLQ